MSISIQAAEASFRARSGRIKFGQDHSSSVQVSRHNRRRLSVEEFKAQAQVERERSRAE